MNKKLKRIKSQMKYWQDCPGESYSVSESTFEWLIEQAEREFSHSIKINKLHFFLDNNVADLASERCGHHVIDVAIYVIKKQAERVQELEKQNKLLRFIAEENKIAYEQRVEQNKRYREALKKIEILWKNATESTDDRQLTWLMYNEAMKALEGEE